MALVASSSSSALSCTPNVTPLIDVLLVLLIIFMVIVPVAPRGLESSIATRSRDLPAAHERSPLVLEILRGPGKNPVVYRLGGRDLRPDQLSTGLRGEAASRAGLPLFLDGDPALDYQAIANAIGVAKGAGFQAVGLLSRTRR